MNDAKGQQIQRVLSRGVEAKGGGRMCRRRQGEDTQQQQIQVCVCNACLCVCMRNPKKRRHKTHMLQVHGAEQGAVSRGRDAAGQSTACSMTEMCMSVCVMEMW